MVGWPHGELDLAVVGAPQEYHSLEPSRRYLRADRAHSSIPPPKYKNTAIVHHERAGIHSASGRIALQHDPWLAHVCV